MVFIVNAALRMVLRHWKRSLIVIGVSLALVLFINMYAGTINQHIETLAEIHANIEVDGHITNSNGSETDNLRISESIITQLEESGFIAKANYGRNMRYMLEPLPQLPALELYALVYNANPLEAINDIASAPGFVSEIKFLDGYDETIFLRNEAVCVVPKGFLLEHGYELGDQLLFTVVERPRDPDMRDPSTDPTNYRHGEISFRIVGEYPAMLSFMPVYFPWDVSTWLYHELGLPLTWDRASFTLQNNENLGQFRELLRELYFGNPAEGQRSGRRLGFIINDSVLINATASVRNYIDFMNALYPLIYFISIVIGFLVSYLLVRIRKPELAIMRSLGSSKGMSFAALFSEQIFLSILGAGLGVLATWVYTHELTSMQLSSVIGYVLFYLIGTAVAIFTINQVNVIKILTAKE